MKKLVLVLTATATALSFGCGDDKGSTAPEVEIYKPQTSIENVIDNLIEAYERQDTVEYGKLFADSFYFVFSPIDIADHPDMPEEWGLADEILSASKMFADSLVEGVTLNAASGAPSAATEADMGDHDFPEGTMKAVLSDVELAVETRQPAGGENIIFQVAGDQAVFFFSPHPTERINELPVWYIVEWRDVRVGALASSDDRAAASIENTWGRIKVRFL